MQILGLSGMYVLDAMVDSMAIRVVEFSNGGYKIKKVFA